MLSLRFSLTSFCIVIGKIKSLQTTITKALSVGLHLPYVTSSGPSHICTCQKKIQGPTRVDLQHSDPGQCKDDWAHTMCEEKDQSHILSLLLTLYILSLWYSTHSETFVCSILNSVIVLLFLSGCVIIVVLRSTRKNVSAGMVRHTAAAPASEVESVVRSPTNMAAAKMASLYRRPACGHVCWGRSASQSMASNASAVLIGRKKSREYLI